MKLSSLLCPEPEEEEEEEEGVKEKEELKLELGDESGSTSGLFLGREALPPSSPSSSPCFGPTGSIAGPGKSTGSDIAYGPARRYRTHTTPALLSSLGGFESLTRIVDSKLERVSWMGYTDKPFLEEGSFAIQLRQRRLLHSSLIIVAHIRCYTIS
jgi:hypothetical protein